MMPDLPAAYPPSALRYDEMLAAPGRPRSHWQRLFEQLAGTSPEALRERAQWVQRQVRENGITYNIYADPEGTDRPWELDTLPLILPADEWAGIGAAIRQRAPLLTQGRGAVHGGRRPLAEGPRPPRRGSGPPP